MKNLILTILLTGCAPTLEGSWSGRSFATDYTMELILVDVDGLVAGTASDPLDDPMTVTGVFAYPSVSLLFTSQEYSAFSFVGDFVNNHEVAGKLKGSGFENTGMRLFRD